MSASGFDNMDAATAAADSQDSTHSNNGKQSQGQQQPLTFWNKPWHLTGGVPRQTPPPPSWKLSSTPRVVNGVLLMCLNIGITPPDVSKPKKCAVMEAWTDPFAQSAKKSLDLIGTSIVRQFKKMGSSVNYILCLLPDYDTVRKQLMENRRAARDNRVLLHYNGHDVPKPSKSGEIWVFNDKCSEYLPVSMSHFESWVGSPSVLIFDCSNAEVPIREYIAASATRRGRETHNANLAQYAELIRSTGTIPLIAEPSLNVILFGACSQNESLPLNPGYPADIFTACMTTPLRMAILWFCNHSLLNTVPIEAAQDLPGSQSDRSSPLGELSWIFTTITDTIAWNTLPREMFQRYFRQDSHVANLFRNFLLADRIMRSLNCVPISYPRLPPTFNHPLWETWDLAVDMCLMQYDTIKNGGKYVPSTFFVEQLRAFEVWLEFGSEEKSPAEQLPIVLQVLLGKNYRPRVLSLLSRFLDLGPWAVLQALSVGIFPYVFKLLGSDDIDMRASLVFIWTKILAFDENLQADFVKNREYYFFINALSASNEQCGGVGQPQPVNVMAAFILSVLISKLKNVKEECLNNNFLQGCLALLAETSPSDSFFRQWLVLCLAKLWDGLEQSQWMDVRNMALSGLKNLMEDESPDVRAATIYALGTLISPTSRPMALNDARADKERDLALQASVALLDANPIVRREMVVLISRLFSGHFQVCGPILRNVILQGEEKSQTGEQVKIGEEVGADGGAAVMGTASSSIYLTFWRGLQQMKNDPQPEVAVVAQKLTAAIHRKAISGEPVGPDDPNNTSLSAFAAANRGSTRIRKHIDLSTLSPMDAPAGSTTPLQQKTRLSLQVGTSPSNIVHGSAAIAPFDTDDQVIAVPSVLYQWCCEYWKAPLMKQEQDQTSPAYKQKEQMKKERAASIILARESYSNAIRNPITTHEVSVLSDQELSSMLIFHPFDPVLLTANQQDTITVWDINQAEKLHVFSNQNFAGSRVNSMLFTNEHDDIHLVTGSSDGVVRVWRDFASRNAMPKMVTSWRAHPQLMSVENGSGLLLDWQDTGRLLAAGDATNVLLWDMVTERVVQHINTLSTFSVTSVTFNPYAPDIFAIGCGDYSLSVFDLRQPSRNSCVASLRPQQPSLKNPIIKAAFTSATDLVSCAPNQVRLWDIRKNVPSLVFADDGLVAFDVHKHAPFMASGSSLSSSAHPIRVYNFKGEVRQDIRFHSGLYSRRINPVTNIALHPYQLMVAATLSDSSTCVFTFDSSK